MFLGLKHFLELNLQISKNTYPLLEYTNGKQPNLARAFFATCGFWASSSLNGSPEKLNEFEILLITLEPVCPILWCLQSLYDLQNKINSYDNGIL